MIESGDMFRAGGPPELRPLGETEFLNGVAAMFASGKYGATLAGAGIVGCPDLAARRAGTAGDRGLHRGRRRPFLRRAQPAHLARSRRASASHAPGRATSCAMPAFRAGLRMPRRLWSTPSMPMSYHRAATGADRACACRARCAASSSITPAVRQESVPCRQSAMKCFGVWESHIRELAQCPNVFMKLGGLGLPVMGFGFQGRMPQASSQRAGGCLAPLFRNLYRGLRSEPVHVRKRFSARQGSLQLPVIWNAFKRIAAGCSPDEKAALFCGTAARAYRLKLA